MKKKTIERAVELEGVGVHSGQNIHLALKPSEAGKIEFIRVDKAKKRIELDPRKSESNFCTSLIEGGVKIRTLEHIMAALAVFGLDSLEIELDGEEIPIMDGSAFPFVMAIQEAGIRELEQEKKRIRITRPFFIQEGEASVGAVPDPNFRISYRIVYGHPAIGEQKTSLDINHETFIRELAPARTFGFLDDVPSLRAQGLALGGSLENAVVLDKKGVVNGKLRFPDEFVRHKVLDYLGDLALFGFPITGHFKGDKAGHRLHRACVQYLLDHPDHWTAF